MLTFEPMQADCRTLWLMNCKNGPMVHLFLSLGWNPVTNVRLALASLLEDVKPLQDVEQSQVILIQAILASWSLATSLADHRHMSKPSQEPQTHEK